jgi:hypothetical protein
VSSRLALTAGLAYVEQKATPTAGVQLRLADGLALAARVKSEGFEPDGAEVEATVLGGLTLGRLDLLASATAGHGEGTWDLEGAAAARAPILPALEGGLEARFRTTPDGARHDLVAGPTLALALSRGLVRLQAIVGYGASELGAGLAAFVGVVVYQ